jgi:uncharacterized membrane protein YkvA (DUF1232 family)
VIRPLLISLGIVAVIYVAAIVALAMAGRRTAAREMAVLLPNLMRLFKDLLTDPRVPRSSKALLLVGVAWIASPIDLIPGFIPFLGPLDDAVVAALIPSAPRQDWRPAGHRGALARRSRNRPPSARTPACGLHSAVVGSALPGTVDLDLPTAHLSGRGEKR